jgi:hypothetical protein
MFCIYLRTNSDLCQLQHKVIGFYNIDLTLYNPVVTICTTSLTCNNCTLCPHSLYVFVYIWKQRANYVNYNIYCLVFMTDLTTYKSLVTICTTSLTFNNYTLCPHSIYVFCFNHRTSSYLCHLLHKLIGFWNRDEKCLQRGTFWGFKWRSLGWLFKWRDNLKHLIPTTDQYSTKL